ncbi:hypothetical protein J19TS2_09720 [Cohnella xylanilytica]|uniref:Uncharacterized protein n=1 Tax=Cohnella xylanilytica TaxID=557555 RepID=A0A841U6A8_9BACL|nr:hypothetical protein [Cohnella xylanilytica]MBB6694598.1 hypothetical protein [Cohnella xylanilytica]GIO11417.1 hypothetical protein J19TS2_09720 [Cohnella xylanilytica]
MLILLAIGFALIASYQAALHRRGRTSGRDRAVAYVLSGLTFVYGLVCRFAPGWANPFVPIRFVFEPVQRLIAGN